MKASKEMTAQPQIEALFTPRLKALRRRRPRSSSDA